MVLSAVFVCVAILISGQATSKEPDLPLRAGQVRSITAGAEMWAILDYKEVQTFNEGVMENPDEQIRRLHEPARPEKWQFGQRFEQFSFDGKRFWGVWKSPEFQAEYFTEFLVVDGEIAQDGKSVVRMMLTKVRFDRPSLEPPESRGYSVVSLLFQDLILNPSLGATVTYRFVPGKIIQGIAGDLSARALLRLPAGETELLMNLDWERFSIFDSEKNQKWIQYNNAKFRKQITDALEAVEI